MVFTDKGRMYRLLVDEIPVGTNASKGVRLGTLINMEPDEKVAAVTSLYRETNAEYVVFFTKKGLIKKTYLSEYTKVKRSTGIAAISIKEGDALANVTFFKDEDAFVVTKKGMSIHFTTSDINPIGRVASGVKSIKLAEDDEVLIGLPIHNMKDSVAIFSQMGLGKKTPLSEFPLQGRAGKGLHVYKTSLNTGDIIGVALVSDNDNILLVGTPNSICISAKDVPEYSRISMGNMMVKGSKITSVVKL
jgi:DNA gyrase subunit A